MDRQHHLQGSPAAARTSTRRGSDPLSLQAGRQLRWPLGALRTLLEGRRSAGLEAAEREFTERAIAELLRAERAATDLIRWSAPRELRPSRCSLSQLAFSLSRALDRPLRQRCRFVVEDGDAEVTTDGSLLVDGVSRVIELALEASESAEEELMLHTHSDEQWATISLINAGSRHEIHPAQQLAESILQRDITALGGRVSLRDAGHRRCVVLSIPRGKGGLSLSQRAAQPQLASIGGAA
jgi:hypothetical protein